MIAKRPSVRQDICLRGPWYLCVSGLSWGEDEESGV